MLGDAPEEARGRVTRSSPAPRGHKSHRPHDARPAPRRAKTTAARRCRKSPSLTCICAISVQARERLARAWAAAPLFRLSGSLRRVEVPPPRAAARCALDEDRATPGMHAAGSALACSRLQVSRYTVGALLPRLGTTVHHRRRPVLCHCGGHCPCQQQNGHERDHAGLSDLNNLPALGVRFATARFLGARGDGRQLQRLWAAESRAGGDDGDVWVWCNWRTFREGERATSVPHAPQRCSCCLLALLARARATGGTRAEG